MTEKDIRWRQRFQNFKNAFSQFEEAVRRQNLDRLAEDGLIQRFEYTFELAWKCLQDILQERGFAEIRGPKPVIQQAFDDGLIEDGVLWMEMLKARNDTSHIYDEKIFQEIYGKARNEFYKPLKELKEKLNLL